MVILEVFFSIFSTSSDSVASAIVCVLLAIDGNHECVSFHIPGGLTTWNATAFIIFYVVAGLSHQLTFC